MFSWNLPLKTIPPSYRHLRSASLLPVFFFLLPFVMPMELILRGAANTLKGVTKNEHLTLPSSRPFMTSQFLSHPKSPLMVYYKRFYHLFTRARMKAKPKKCWSLSLVRRSVWEIHSKIGGVKIPTVREKPVTSLGHLYSIPLTDCHRGTGVQKVGLKGLKSIDKTCLPRNMVCYPVFCGPYRCTRLRYLPLNGFNSIATNICISGSEFFFVLRKWVYIPILETYISQYPHW